MVARKKPQSKETSDVQEVEGIKEAKVVQAEEKTVVSNPEPAEYKTLSKSPETESKKSPQEIADGFRVVEN